MLAAAIVGWLYVHAIRVLMRRPGMPRHRNRGGRQPAATPRTLPRFLTGTRQRPTPTSTPSATS